MPANLDVRHSRADIADIAGKIDPLICRLAADYDGERLATVAAIERVLIASGVSWHDLADALAAPPIVMVAPPRPERATWVDLPAIASELDRHPDLSPWETDFVSGVLRTLCCSPLSRKQRRILQKIWDRIAEVAA